MKRTLFLGGLVVISLFYTSGAMAFESSPIGWASYNTITNPDPTQTPNLAGTTGGAGGNVVTVTDENSLRKWASALNPDGSHPTDVNILGPYIIQVQGTITLTARVDIMPNRTVIGIGTDPSIVGELRVKGDGTHPGYNVIIKNLSIRDSLKSITTDGDGVLIQNNAHHVWVDHCNITNCEDGALDISHASDYITVSWNHFYNHDKTCLLGASDKTGSEDTGHFKVTYHHNWFDGTTQRHPRVRYAFLTHVYNNYYLNNSGYGVASTCSAKVLVEGCYFKNVADPAHVGEDASPAGDLVVRNNIYDNSGAPVPQGTCPEPNTYYSYMLDDTNNIPAIVQYGAGVDGKDGTPPHWFYGPYGDFDRSGFVDMNDFAQFARYWPINDCNQLFDADYNGDCKVNFYEFSLFAENWLYLPPSPPAAPTGLWALAGNGTVSLDWANNNETDLAGYIIYRSTTSGNDWSKLNGSLLSDSNYIDNSIVNGTMYYYVVTATDTSSEESGNSAQACAVPDSNGSSITLQENATGFCSVNGKVESEWAGFTGAGYANTDNAAGNGINYKISIPSDGNYTFVWRYALEAGNRTAKLLVNSSEVVPSISFPASGANTTYILTTPIDVNLTAGIKDIRLEAIDSNGLANIDYLKVTGTNPAAASCN